MITAKNWRGIAAAQLDTETLALVNYLTVQLRNSELRSLGEHLLDERLRGAAIFATTTLPPAQRDRLAYDAAYLIMWIFALDILMDSCENLSIALEIQTLLERQLALPLATTFQSEHIEPTFSSSIEGQARLAFSPLTLVAALQPLRRSLARQSDDPMGLKLFDQYLLQKVAPAMLTETMWRLGQLPMPSYDQYLETAHISICGGLCLRALNAVFPRPDWHLAAVEMACETLCFPIRLANDAGTWQRDAEEGKPNALLLLAAELGSLQAGQNRLRQILDSYAADLDRLCLPFIEREEEQDALYVLYYYIFYCYVMTEAMYAEADFLISTEEAKNIQPLTMDFSDYSSPSQ